MTKFNSVRYQGFTMGVRVADQFVMLSLDQDVKTAGLHSLKNIANTMGLMNEVRALGINNYVYGGTI